MRIFLFPTNYWWKWHKFYHVIIFANVIGFLRVTLLTYFFHIPFSKFKFIFKYLIFCSFLMLVISWTFLCYCLIFWIFFWLLHKFSLYKPFSINLSLSVYFLYVELCICTANDNGLWSIWAFIVVLWQAMFGYLNDWRLGWLFALFLPQSLFWSWNLGQLVNIELINPVIASITFWDWLPIFL